MATASIDRPKSLVVLIFIIVIISAFVVLSVHHGTSVQIFNIADMIKANNNKPTKGSKYLIISLNIDNPYGDGSIAAVRNHKKYASIHNYTYKVFTRNDLFDINLERNTSLINVGPILFYKAHVIYYAFTHYSFDYLLFMDNDALFTNYTVKLDEVLSIANDSQYQHHENGTMDISFIWSRRVVFINSGVMLIKHTPFIFDNIIKEWHNLALLWSQYKIIAPRNKDQQLLAAIMKGKTCNDLKEIAMDSSLMNDSYVDSEAIWSKMETGDQCLDTHASAHNTLHKCVDSKFHKYIAIIPYEIFNCISPNISTCNRFIQHFAGRRIVDKVELLIDKFLKIK